MKTKLGILIVLVFLWCLLGCDNLGGGNTADKQDTSDQSRVYPDSLRVKDTVIIDVEKRKTGQ